MPKILISSDGKSVGMQSVSRYIVEKLNEVGKVHMIYDEGKGVEAGVFVSKRLFVAGQLVVIAVEETHISDLLDTVCAANKLYAACKEAGVQSDYELQLKVAGMIY